MREKLTVIKVGGKIVEEEATLRQLLNDFAAIDGHKVLVHGGGRSATKIAAQLGIESKMVNGQVGGSLAFIARSIKLLE